MVLGALEILESFGIFHGVFDEIFIGPGGRGALDSVVFHYVSGKMMKIFTDPIFQMIFRDFFGEIVELLLLLILDDVVKVDNVYLDLRERKCMFIHLYYILLKHM